MSGGTAERFHRERYIAYDFLIGNPILIDRAEKTLTLFRHNIYGQIYNLATAQPRHIGRQQIDGLIRRTANPNYGFYTAKVIDSYIYAYFMTPAQRARCERTPDTHSLHKTITATDDYGEAIRDICEWVYENEYCVQLGEKEERREELLQYYKNHLMRYPTPQAVARDRPPEQAHQKKRPAVSR